MCVGTKVKRNGFVGNRFLQKHLLIAFHKKRTSLKVFAIARSSFLAIFGEKMHNSKRVRRVQEEKLPESVFQRLVRRSMPSKMYDKGVKSASKRYFAKLHRKERGY